MHLKVCRHMIEEATMGRSDQCLAQICLENALEGGRYDCGRLKVWKGYRTVGVTSSFSDVSCSWLMSRNPFLMTVPSCLFRWQKLSRINICLGVWDLEFFYIQTGIFCTIVGWFGDSVDVRRLCGSPWIHLGHSICICAKKINIYIHTCMHTNITAYRHNCVRTYVYIIYIHTYMYTYIYVCMNVYKHIYRYICI